MKIRNSSTGKNKKSERRFTPSPSDRAWIWQHYATLEYRLYRHGSKEEIKEAIAGAIAKCLGDHPKFHLEKPLVNVTENELVWHVWWEAKSILSHIHEHELRFPIRKYQTLAEVQRGIAETLENKLISERQREITLSGLNRLLRVLELWNADPGNGNRRIPRFDRKTVHNELIRIVDQLFSEHNVKQNRRKAFLDAFFTEKSSKERADENGMTIDAVDVSKWQVLKFLAKHRSAFKASRILSDYFQFMLAA